MTNTTDENRILGIPNAKSSQLTYLENALVKQIFLSLCGLGEGDVYA